MLQSLLLILQLIQSTMEYHRVRTLALCFFPFMSTIGIDFLLE